MSSRVLSLAETKNHFSECVRAAENGGTVIITRHGKTTAAIVPAGDVKLLERLRAARPESGLASVAGGWKGSDELVRLVRGRRRTRRRRTVGTRP